MIQCERSVTTLELVAEGHRLAQKLAAPTFSYNDLPENFRNFLTCQEAPACLEKTNSIDMDLWNSFVNTPAATLSESLQSYSIT